VMFIIALYYIHLWAAQPTTGVEWWGPKVNYKACSFRIRDLSISEKFVGWRRTCITGFFSGKGFDISSYWTFNSQDRG